MRKPGSKITTWVSILRSAGGGGGGGILKAFLGKIPKKKLFMGTERQKKYLFSLVFWTNPSKIRHFSYKWAFFLIYFNIWHLFLTIWQIFLKIILFALQQNRIFQNHPLSKIRIFWKNIHPWWQVQVTVRWGSNLKINLWHWWTWNLLSL